MHDYNKIFGVKFWSDIIYFCITLPVCTSSYYNCKHLFSSYNKTQQKVGKDLKLLTLINCIWWHFILTVMLCYVVNEITPVSFCQPNFYDCNKLS